jgi:hypothetical protein
MPLGAALAPNEAECIKAWIADLDPNAGAGSGSSSGSGGAGGAGGAGGGGGAGGM